MLDVVISSLDGKLKEIASTVKNELGEIEKRWLAVTKELVQTKNEVNILRMEIVRMSDGYQRLEKSITILLAAQRNGAVTDE